jgi:hypothetical protein
MRDDARWFSKSETVDHLQDPPATAGWMAMLPQAISPKDRNRSRLPSNKINHLQVCREILDDAEMDRRVSDFLRRCGPQRVNFIMKAVKTFPTHGEVRASLVRIGAQSDRAHRWSLPK